MTADLLARIRGIVVSERVQDAIPARIIAEIETTHYLIDCSTMDLLINEAWNGNSVDVHSLLLRLVEKPWPGDLDPMSPNVAPDTPEGGD